MSLVARARAAARAPRPRGPAAAPRALRADKRARGHVH